MNKPIVKQIGKTVVDTVIKNGVPILLRSLPLMIGLGLYDDNMMHIQHGPSLIHGIPVKLSDSDVFKHVSKEDFMHKRVKKRRSRGRSGRGIMSYGSGIRPYGQ